MLFEILDLRRCVIRVVVQHGNRYDSRQLLRNSALKEKIEADLRFLVVDRALGIVPWIDRRSIRRRLLLIRSMPHQIVEHTIRRHGSHIDLTNCVSGAVAWI